MVPQQKSSSWRPYGDYCKLNAITLSNKYSIANMQDFTMELKFFLNLISSEPTTEEFDIKKTAITMSSGLYKFLLLALDYRIYILDSVFCYTDDVLIASPSSAEHKWHFERFKKYGVVVNPIKCKFEVNFLGHKIHKNGIKPLPERTKAISCFLVPKTFKNLH